jgi:hypothetical protein
VEPEKDSSSQSQKPSLLQNLLGTLVVVVAFVASFWSKFKTPVEQSVTKEEKTKRRAGWAKRQTSCLMSPGTNGARKSEGVNKRGVCQMITQLAWLDRE